MTKKCKAALVCILHSIVHIFIVFHKNGDNVCDTCVLCKYQLDVKVCSGLDEVFNQGLQYKKDGTRRVCTQLCSLHSAQNDKSIFKINLFTTGSLKRLFYPNGLLNL